MHEEALTKESAFLLSSFGRFPDFYLVGGTALALQIGHRLSIDFDFFSNILMPTNLREIGFENHIEKCLIEQQGYEQRSAREYYDKELCVDRELVMRFLQSTQPEQWEKLAEHHGDLLEEKFFKRLDAEIAARGLLDVLRNGIQDNGCKFSLAYFQPASGLNEETIHLFGGNILSVVRQLKYSRKNENCIDMVFFLNGLPFATVELKNQLTGQSVAHGMRQYKSDRDPAEKLLSFKRCLVHMAVDTEQGLYVFAPDQVARLEIPAALSGELLAANNASGSDILIRSVNEGSDAPKSIFNSVRFEAVRTPGNQVVDRFSFSSPGLTVAVRYEVSGSQVTPSAAGPLAISAGDAAQRLGLYWNNGEKYVKLYGKVDTVNQLVSVKTAMTGSYQVRALYRDNSVHFDISGLTNRAITPNGDGLNDTTVFTFDNPRDSAFSGKIYDLSGAFVADMTPGPVSNSLQWNGRAGGRAVASGVYAYQIKAENKVFNGTLMVIK